MNWFPPEIKSSPGWRIQFMGVVAWLGASAIDKHSNAMVTSPFRYLPRIIPGPWDLSKTGLTRLLYKTNSTLRAAGCQARLEFPFIGTLPDQLYMIIPEMQDSRHHVPLSIHRWSIRFNCERISLQPEQKPRSCKNGEPCSVFATIHQSFSEFINSISPTDFLTILSSLITIGLASFCATRKDGSAVLGLTLISIHTILSSREIRVRVGDYLSIELKTTFELVIRTPENAFWIIECDKLAYNALVWGGILLPTGKDCPNNSKLLNPRQRHRQQNQTFLYPLLLILLILSLFMFCNATFISQLAITSAYILLTALYMIISPLGVCPGELNVATKYDSFSPTSHLQKPEERRTERDPTMARAVWYVIKLTRSTTWVRSVDAIPDSPGWNRWLEEACKNIDCPDWPAEGEKKRLVDNNKSIYNLPEMPEGSTNREAISVIPVHESKW